MEMGEELSPDSDDNYGSSTETPRPALDRVTSRQSSDNYSRTSVNSTSANIATNLSAGSRPEIAINDEAVDVSESGASKVTSTEPPRLLILSNRVKFTQVMQAAVLSNVKVVYFKHDGCDLDGILSTIATSVHTQKFESIALIFNCSGATISLCGLDEKLLTKETIIEMTSIREFFTALTNNHIDRSWVNARLDLLMCSAAMSLDGEMITTEISQITKIPCGISKDLLGANIPLKRIGEEESERTVGSLYFRLDRLRPTSSKQSMSLFEKIRTVGKGAYGSAVLYRKKDDSSLVILKEINMHDLNAMERQMALNEVKVLSMLEHPNIISYFDSFEEDGILMIEMDYADGGTLAQLLAKRDQLMEERRILEMFSQMVAAIRYIHGHKILHRDLKTQNIFLTVDGVIKMGDFGISKMLTTGGKDANTVVGTPYYISPEMCEGKPYGPKSDIWALGCILYEMACLERTFEGSNLPAVVNKIMKGVYTPVKGPYSSEFKEIVQKMLDKDPIKRPSADELWTEILPTLMTRYTDDYRSEEADDDLGNSADSTQNNRKKTMSVLYYLQTQSLGLSTLSLPNKIKVKEVYAGKDHAIIVSQECMVYTYGKGTDGQLGHGDEKSRTSPTLVEALKGKSVNRACCGDGFSIFSSSNGIVMTCGDAASGCLGQGDDQSLSKPKLIEALLHVDVASIACGDHHVAIVGTKGEVYTWGDGTQGKLGLGNEDSHILPQEVPFSEPVNVREVFCGEDGTMFLTDEGIAWACGSNKNNKLGLNNRQGFIAALKHAFNPTEVTGAKQPAIVKDLCRFIVTSISMGLNHTAVLIEGGKVITFGRNVEGQLGLGDNRNQQGLVHVKQLDHVNSTQICCSPLSTIVSVSNGQILLLGSRHKTAPPLDIINWLDPSLKRQNSQSEVKSRSRQGSAGSQRSQRSLSQTSLSSAVRDSDRQSSAASTRKVSVDRLLSDMDADSEPSIGSKRASSGQPSQRQSSASNRTSRQASVDDLEVHHQPTPILNFQSDETERVNLTGFTCHKENVFVLLETTAPPTAPPPPKQRPKKRRPSNRNLVRSEMSSSRFENYTNFKSSASSREAGDELSASETSEMDTLGTVPLWIKAELADAEILNHHADVDDSGDDTEDENRMSGKPPISPTKPTFSAYKSNSSRPSAKATVFKTGKELSASTAVHASSESSTDYESDGEDESSQPIAQQESHGNVARVTPQSSSQKSKLPAQPVKSHGRPKSSKAVRSVAPMVSSSSATSQSGISNTESNRRERQLQEEIARMKREAENNELRMSRLEDSYRRKAEDIDMKSENERQLQSEVQMLREELFAQNRKMQENFQMVMGLQEQLVKMQSTSMQVSDNSNTNSNRRDSGDDKKSQPTSKSSICLIQ